MPAVASSAGVHDEANFSVAKGADGVFRYGCTAYTLFYELSTDIRVREATKKTLDVQKIWRRSSYCLPLYAGRDQLQARQVHINRTASPPAPPPPLPPPTHARTASAAAPAPRVVGVDIACCCVVGVFVGRTSTCLLDLTASAFLRAPCTS